MAENRALVVAAVGVAVAAAVGLTTWLRSGSGSTTSAAPVETTSADASRRRRRARAPATTTRRRRGAAANDADESGSSSEGEDEEGDEGDQDDGGGARQAAVKTSPAARRAPHLSASDQRGQRGQREGAAPAVPAQRTAGQRPPATLPQLPTPAPARSSPAPAPVPAPAPAAARPSPAKAAPTTTTATRIPSGTTVLQVLPTDKSYTGVVRKLGAQPAPTAGRRSSKAAVDDDDDWGDVEIPAAPLRASAARLAPKREQPTEIVIDDDDDDDAGFGFGDSRGRGGRGSGAPAATTSSPARRPAPATSQPPQRTAPLSPVKSAGSTASRPSGPNTPAYQLPRATASPAFLASSAASSSNHTTSDEDSFFGDELQMPVGGLPRKPRTADISMVDDWDDVEMPSSGRLDASLLLPSRQPVSRTTSQQRSSPAPATSRANGVALPPHLAQKRAERIQLVTEDEAAEYGFGAPTSTGGTAKGRRPSAPAATRTTYADGTELDGLADLPVDRAREAALLVTPSATSPLAPGRTGLHVPSPGGKRHANAATVPGPRHGSKATPTTRPTLIAPTDASLARHEVGEMVYNAERHVWEGNRQALKAFDRPEPSRIGLVTNLGRANVPQAIGDMVYDPDLMVWHGNEADAARFSGLDVAPSAPAAAPATPIRNVFSLDADAVRRLRDAERAHNESMGAWPQSRRYGHEHLMQIRDIAELVVDDAAV